ncbi:hypothetical protein ACI6Q2_08880 [Chitinophagaceae bacterium LWZ2-11]
MQKRLVYFASITLLLLITTFGCKQGKPSFQKEFVIDTLKNGIESIKGIRNDFKLYHLEKGYDSLQIRIWISNSISSKQQLITIENFKKKWEGRSIEFEPVYFDNGKFDSVLSYKRVENELTPKSSWNIFLDKIYSDSILTLPDQVKIKGYDHPVDGWNVTIEVGTQNYYRLYSYHAPDANDSIPQAKAVIDILHAIEDEFDITVLYLPKRR